MYCLSSKVGKGMEKDNLLQKKSSITQKVATSIGKGQRELRNLISSVNYDGR